MTRRRKGEEVIAEEIFIANNTVFYYLGQAITKHFGVEGGQGVDIANHQPGLVEGPDFVLQLAVVYGYLTPDTAINLGEQGSR